MLPMTWMVIGGFVDISSVSQALAAQTASNAEATQGRIAVSVLKQTLNLQADLGARLSAMISQGTGIDIQA